MNTELMAGDHLQSPSLISLRCFLSWWLKATDCRLVFFWIYTIVLRCDLRDLRDVTCVHLCALGVCTSAHLCALVLTCVHLCWLVCTCADLCALVYTVFECVQCPLVVASASILLVPRLRLSHAEFSGLSADSSSWRYWSRGAMDWRIIHMNSWLC